MYCSARSSPFEEEKAGQRKTARDHHLAGYIKLSQHWFCSLQGTVNILMCFSVCMCSHLHNHIAWTNKQTTCHSCPEKRMHWACTEHAQTNNPSFIALRRGFSFRLDLRNDMHQQTNNQHCHEKHSPSVWIFKITCTNRQTTCIALRRGFSFRSSQWQLDPSPFEDYVKAMWKLHWETNPSSFLSLLCIAPPQKKPSKNRRMKQCGRAVGGNGGDFFSFLTWVGRIAVSRVDRRWSKDPRMVIMESVMLWLFPRLSRMNCALAANSSTSLNSPIPQFPPTPQNPTTITPSTQRSL